jgi:hypothetical protein
MYTAGNPTKDHVSDAYFSYNGGRLCAMVLSRDGSTYPIQQSAGDSWLKIYDNASSAMQTENGNTNVAYIVEGGITVGWEACYTVSPTCYTMVEIHANYGSGDTTSTGKNQQGYISLNLNDQTCGSTTPIVEEISTPAPVADPVVTIASGNCALPPGTRDYSVITSGDATIEAHLVYTKVAVGGTFRKFGGASMTVNEAAYMMTLSGNPPINWNGGKQTGTALSTLFNFADFEWLAQNAVSSEDGIYKVVVFNNGGTYSVEDLRGPEGQESDNGATLVIFNTSDDVTLTKSPLYDRKFGSSIIAPFSTVKVLGEAGFIDGLIVAKVLDSNLGSNPGSLQLHGKTYHGPITCSSDPCAPISKEEEVCIPESGSCYRVTRDERTNAYGGCCEGMYCSSLSTGFWSPRCDPFPTSDYTPPPNPKGITEYIPPGCPGTENDNCPEAMNLGYGLSASTDFQGDFPTTAPAPVPRGRDDAIGFFVKGTYTSNNAAEIEGMVVILGDAIIKSSGLSNFGNSIGSGIVPNDDQVVVTGKYIVIQGLSSYPSTEISHV